jgi:hypothetical protein
MDAVYVKENLRVSWVAESGIPENVAAIVKEYRTTRGLLVSQNNITSGDTALPFWKSSKNWVSLPHTSK